MDRINIIGIDISKRSFQLHGATAEGKPVFGKKLSREKFLVFLSEAPPCLVVMEACGGAHYWGRQILALGHTCKLIPPIYVKPFLKRQKNDSNDAAAIVACAAVYCVTCAVAYESVVIVRAYNSERAKLSPEMALRIEEVFGGSMDTLLRMQTSYDIAQTRKREGDIELVPFEEQVA